MFRQIPEYSRFSRFVATLVQYGLLLLMLDGKTVHATITMFLTNLGSMVAACCP